MGVTELVFELEVFAGHIVALVACSIKKMTATCSPMIGYLRDTVIVASKLTPFTVL